MEDNFSIEYRLKTAMDLYEREQYNDAAEEFLAIIEQFGKDAGLYNNLGMCYYQVGSYEEATKAYNLALTLDPKMPEVYMNMADVYYAQDDMFEALTMLKTAIEIEPENVKPRYHFARLLIEDARYDEAVEELETILSIDEFDIDSRYDLAKLYYDMGSYDKAVPEFKTVVDKYPDNPDILYHYALSLEGDGMLEEAEKVLDKIIKVHKTYILAYKKLAVLYMAQRHFEKAVAMLEHYRTFNIPDEEKEEIALKIEKIRSLHNF